MCAESRGIAGAKALLRWSSEEHDQLSPTELIPVLESYRLVGQVGRWVPEQSFTQCKRWSEAHPGFIMDVNISYRQLLDAVRAIGADSIEGFFVSCPIPAHSFEERFITPQTAS